MQEPWLQEALASWLRTIPGKAAISGQGQKPQVRVTRVQLLARRLTKRDAVPAGSARTPRWRARCHTAAPGSSVSPQLRMSSEQPLPGAQGPPRARGHVQRARVRVPAPTLVERVVEGVVDHARVEGGEGLAGLPKLVGVHELLAEGAALREPLGGQLCGLRRPEANVVRGGGVHGVLFLAGDRLPRLLVGKAPGQHGGRELDDRHSEVGVGAPGCSDGREDVEMALVRHLARRHQLLRAVLVEVLEDGRGREHCATR
mmetsp:Transcript_11152/g.37964  ORF Transcript_11152/g.37964 Transcript_11152/m.37964 type:complete len:258 (+) Transcript_11152:93-866(+)